MGEGRSGCLGHGDTRDLASPKIVEALLGDDITALAAGSAHMAVVTGDGELFTWGQGGGLGQGQGDRETLTSPELVDTEEDVEKVRYVVKSQSHRTMMMMMLGCVRERRHRCDRR